MVTEGDEGPGITSIIFVRACHHLGTSIDYYHCNGGPFGRVRDAINELLARGFVFVHRADGSLARSASALKTSEAVELEFRDGRRGAVIDARAAKKSPGPAAPAPSGQGDLF